MREKNLHKSMKKRENVHVFDGTPQWNYPTLHNYEGWCVIQQRKRKKAKLM